MGTMCVVRTGRSMSPVALKARVVARREGDCLIALRARIVDRLYLTISPLPTRLNTLGWQFGEALRPFNVYEVIKPEPGVAYVGSDPAATCRGSAHE